jgi:hypothetical protein
MRLQNIYPDAYANFILIINIMYLNFIIYFLIVFNHFIFTKTILFLELNFILTSFTTFPINK